MAKVKKNVKATCLHVKGGEIDLREFNGGLTLRVDPLDGRTKPVELELTVHEVEELRNILNRFLGVRSDLVEVTPTVYCGRNAQEWRALYIEELMKEQGL